MSKSKGELLGFLVIAVVKNDNEVDTRLIVRGGIEVDEARTSPGKAYAVAFNPESMHRYERPDDKAIQDAQELLEGLVTPMTGCAKPKRCQG